MMKIFRKLILVITALFLFNSMAYAGLITVPTVSSDATIDMLNNNFSVIKNEINGSLDEANIEDDSLTEAEFSDAINPRVRDGEIFNSFTYTGMLPATDVSDLTSDISLGTSYVEGYRVVTAATSKTYTASKDTWVYIDINGTFQYEAVANDALQPTTPANSLLLAKVVTDGDNITSVDDKRVLTASSYSTEDFYIKGMVLLSADRSAVSIDTGVVYHGSTRFEKTSVTELTLTTADDWWDGAVDTFTGTGGWCFVAINDAGDIKLLGFNQPTKADTDGNTEGNLIYWYDASGAEYWRVLTEVSVDTGNIVASAEQHGDWVMFTEAPPLTDAVASDGVWSSALSTDMGVPRTSSYAQFTMGFDGNGAAVYVAGSIRANNTIGLTPNVSTFTGNTVGIAATGGVVFSAVDSEQKIQHQEAKSAGTLQNLTINVVGYRTNLRD